MQLAFGQRWPCWEGEEKAFLNNMISLATDGRIKRVEVNNINLGLNFKQDN